MGGQLGEALNELANKFNAEQKDYKIVTSYKGSYPESMTAAIAAFRAGQAPHILQVFEVGTATMMAAKGAVKPVYQLMKEQGEPFDPKAYLPTVTGYYSDRRATCCRCRSTAPRPSSTSTATSSSRPACRRCRRRPGRSCSPRPRS